MLSIDNLSVSFGGVRALDSASFHVAEGDTCGLIGPNGAGKTTLFNCVSRLYTPDTGRISFQETDLLRLAPQDIAITGIARTFQNLGLVQGLTVLDNVMLGTHVHTHVGFVRAPFTFPGRRREERASKDLAMQLLRRLELERYASASVRGLPYGTLKRLELARALAAQPTLLMLDEPASGLTHGEVNELIDVIIALKYEFQLTVLLVEHHMGMVMRMSDKVVALDQGQVISQGTAQQVQEDERVITAYLGAPV